MKAAWWILDHAGMILLVAAAVDIMVWGVVVGVVLYRRRNHLRKVEE